MRRKECLSLILVAALLGGCTLRQEINRHWPPISTDEYRDRAISAADATLDDLIRVDGAAHLARDTLSQHLAPAVMAQLPSVRGIDVSTREQQLIAEVPFDHEFAAEKVRVKGEATIHLAAAIQDQHLVLQPSFSRLRVSSIVFHDRKSKLGAEILTALLETFLQNVNGAIAAQRVELDFGVLQDVVPRNLLGSLPHLSELSGSPLHVEVLLEQAAILIDNAGVHLAAKLSEGGAPIAVRSSARFATRPPSFAEFAARFRARLDQDLGETPTNVWERTGIAVSKRYLSGQLNYVLRNPGLCATFRPPGQLQRFNDLLRLDHAPDLKCEDGAKQHSCSIDMDCTPTRDCNPHWNCPDCQWYDAPCHALKTGCELDKARYRGQCEIGKTAEKTSCEGTKEWLRIDCEREKAARKLGCLANQAWLTAWTGAHVGRIEGSATIGDISARLCLLNASMAEDLSSLTLSTTLEAIARVSAEFVYTPLDAGHIACVAQWGGSIKAAVGVPPSSLPLRATIDEFVDGSRSSLELRSASQKLTLRTVPPPMLALLRENPHALVVCAPAAVLGLIGVTVSPKIRADLLRSDFPVSLPEQQFRFSLADVDMTVAGHAVTLHPEWVVRAVRFVVTD